jgi:transposase
MELTESQFQRIADCLPRQRGNVGMTDLQLLNALLYMVEHGCKWRGLPKHFWQLAYDPYADESLEQSQGLGSGLCPAPSRTILAIHIEHVCSDSTTIKVHPDGTGALKTWLAGHRPLPGRLHH